MTMQLAEHGTAATHAVAAGPVQEYLTFTLGNEEYGATASTGRSRKSWITTTAVGTTRRICRPT